MSVEFAICAIFKNEALYLKEWIEFHRLVGCSRFFLYDNESTDGWREVLAPYVEGGIVSVEPWSQPPHQMTAYNAALQERLRRRDAEWCAFIDLDEFIVPEAGMTVPKVLRDYRGAGAVAVHWRTFGSSGHVKRPAGLVIENYTHRTPDDAVVNRHYKSIVNCARLSAGKVLSPHALHLIGKRTINTMGVAYSAPAWAMPHITRHLPNRVLGWLHRWGSRGILDKIGKTAAPPQGTARLVIHHYFCKSLEDWQARMRRGDANDGAYGDGKAALHSAYDAISTVEDRTAAQRFGNELRRILSSAHVMSAVEDPV